MVTVCTNFKQLQLWYRFQILFIGFFCNKNRVDIKRLFQCLESPNYSIGFGSVTSWKSQNQLQLTKSWFLLETCMYFQRWNKYTCALHREENAFDNTPGRDKTIRLIYWWNLRKISFFFWTDTTIQRILGIHYSQYRSEGCSSDVMEQGSIQEGGANIETCYFIVKYDSWYSLFSVP